MESNVSVSTFQKILKLVEYESARRKSMLKKNHEKRGTHHNTLFIHNYFSLTFVKKGSGGGQN